MHNFRPGVPERLGIDYERLSRLNPRLIYCAVTGYGERHGITLGEVQPVVDALAAGDVAGAIEKFLPELAERLSLAGTPEECVEKIKRDIEPAGVGHMILALSDPHIVALFSGEQVADVPGVNEQLRLVAERIMPAFT